MINKRLDEMLQDLKDLKELMGAYALRDWYHGYIRFQCRHEELSEYAKSNDIEWVEITDCVGNEYEGIMIGNHFFFSDRKWQGGYKDE